MILEKKIVPWLTICSFTFFSLLVNSACSSLKSENERLKEEIANLTTENEKLRKEITSLRDENSKMHIHLAQLNLQIASLQNEIQLLQKDIDKFRTKLKGEEKKGKKS